MSFRSFRSAASLTLTATALLLSSNALAQQAPPPAEEPAGEPADAPAADEPMEPQAPTPPPPAQGGPGMAPPPPGMGPMAPPMYEPEPPDGVRFRGGVQVEGGALIIPSAINLGVAGVSGQLGVQINNLVGVYAVPQLDVVFGSAGGIHIAGALMTDFTFDDIVSVGIGPDVALFAAIGADDDATVQGAAGALYGARIRGAVHPVVGKGDNGYSRKSLTIGLDIRLMAGTAASAEVGPDGESATVTNFVFAPQLTIGYQSF